MKIRYISIVGFSMLLLGTGVAIASKSIAWVATYYNGPKDYIEYLANDRCIPVMLETALGNQNELLMVPFDVVSRVELPDVTYDKSDKWQATEITKLVDADYGCYGYLTIIGASIRLDCRLVSQDGKFLWTWGGTRPIDKFDELVGVHATALVELLTTKPATAKTWQDYVALHLVDIWYEPESTSSPFAYVGIDLRCINKSAKTVCGIEWQLEVLDEFGDVIETKHGYSYDILECGAVTPKKPNVDSYFTSDYFEHRPLAKVVQRNQFKVRVQISKLAFTDGEVIQFPNTVKQTIPRSNLAKEIN